VLGIVNLFTTLPSRWPLWHIHPCGAGVQCARAERAGGV